MYVFQDNYCKSVGIHKHKLSLFESFVVLYCKLNCSGISSGTALNMECENFVLSLETLPLAVLQTDNGLGPELQCLLKVKQDLS